MPRNKPHKKVSLTKTKKKGVEIKHRIVDEIRKHVDSYENVYVFSFSNFRNSLLKEVKLKWKENGRFFFSKNRVMALALGRTSNEEVAENLNLVSAKLIGNRGLFFTNAPKEEVLSYFDSHSCPNYAKAGEIAKETIEIPEGPLEQFSHSLEPYLRKLGLPVLLKKGLPFVLSPHMLCTKGEVINPQNAKLLKLFDEKLSLFKITMEFLWTKDGSFEDLGRTKGILFKRKPSNTSKSERKTKKKTATKNKDTMNSEGEHNTDDDEGIEASANEQEMDSDHDDNEQETVDDDEMDSEEEN